MRRADRLFMIVQYLRARRLTTAHWLADKLGVSVRTVYRDIQSLSLSGIAVEGEAGVGYALRQIPDLPPLQFDRDEVMAINLGLRFVLGRTAIETARSASSALAKVRNVLPPGLRREIDAGRLFVPVGSLKGIELLKPLNEAIAAQRKVRLDYEREDGAPSTRILRPLALFHWGNNAWTLLAWCEERCDFRSFRLDRIRTFVQLPDHFADEPGRRLVDYIRRMARDFDVPPSAFDPESVS